MHRDKNLGGQWALSLGVMVIGLFFFIGSWWIPDSAGYSTVGPALVPRVVGAALLLLSAMLCWEVFRGGFRHHDEASEQVLPFDWRAFAWLTAGLMIYGLLIERAGFIIASCVLFVCVARAFRSPRWLSNTLIALLLSISIFALFTYGLGLNLPKGILRGVL